MLASAASVAILYYSGLGMVSCPFLCMTMCECVRLDLVLSCGRLGSSSTCIRLSFASAALPSGCFVFLASAWRSRSLGFVLMAAFVQGFGRDPYPCNSRLLTRHQQPSVALAWRTALFWILGDRRAWFAEQFLAIRRRYLLRSVFGAWLRAFPALLPY